jgi:Ala-tRNA(Pro) deacylase
MATATWIRNELDSHGIAYQELHHPEVYTAQQVAEREHISGHRVAKVVCVLADDKPVELVLPASRRVRLDWVQDMLGCRTVRLANEAEMERYFTDCEVGAIPALRHWQGIDVVMDENLRVDGDIVLQGGTHQDAIRMAFKDWFALVQPRVGRLGEPAQARAEHHGKRWWPW